MSGSLTGVFGRFKPGLFWIVPILLGLFVVPNAASSVYYQDEPEVRVAAVTYYVSINGSDLNPGTEAQPWRTIQKAANTMVAGDTCIVLPGYYAERVNISRAGALGAPITFQAAVPVTVRGFTIRADYIDIKGFEITDTVDDWVAGWGIYVKASNCLLEDNYIYDNVHGGITLTHDLGNPTQTSNCVVRNNKFYHNGQLGVEVRGRNHLIEGNEVWGTIQYHPDWPNPPSWVDADGMRFFGSGHVFRANYIHHISYEDPENVDPHIDCFQSWGNESYEAGRDVIFERNRCQILEPPLDSYAATQGWMVVGGYNLLLRNNIVQAYNVAIFDRSNLVTIVNNTFASELLFPDGTGSNGVKLYLTPNTTVKNNIFYDISSAAVTPMDSESLVGLNTDYNSKYRSDGRAPKGSPSPNDLWAVDPVLEDPAGGDFHLQDSSPCIDRGDHLINLVPDDYDGTGRPYGSSYDIGAYEYTGPIPVPGIIVLDDAGPGFSTQSTQDEWQHSIESEDAHYGDGYWYNHRVGTGKDFAQWSFSLPMAGLYDVYAWWTAGSERPGDVPYIVNFDGGTSTIRVDQRTNGGQWNRLGTFNFRDQGSVVVSDDASSGSDIVADAIRLVYQWPYSSYLPSIMRGY